MIIRWMPCYPHIRYTGRSDRYSAYWLTEKVP
jgi:hypothetical protein